MAHRLEHIYTIGLGLIGGSLLKDLRILHPEASLYGIDTNPEHLEEAISLGLVDAAATIDDLSKADLVILAIPVDRARAIVSAVLDAVADSTLVVDMGSTKAGICAEVKQHPKRRNYLAMHPIAGTEFSGPGAAVTGLFKGKTNIICEVEKTTFALQELGLQLTKDLGMRIRYMDAESHDKHIAYVSHLSHISSFMLGKTVMDIEKDEQDIFDLAGSGFESTVRLAKSNPDMWAPIFSQNKDYLLECLSAYIANLETFKAYVEASDEERMHSEMQQINKIKDILNGISLGEHNI
ncbi:MAG: prephenate dehydrogenase [Gilvibacter sp.]